jgi:hypothetical protein
MIGLIQRYDPWLEAFCLLGALWIVYLIVNRSWRFWRLAVGVDGRYSSSRFHGLSWTLVVLFGYSAMYFARVHAGSTTALQAIPPNVLTALGLSLGTTAAAAGITSGRIARKQEVRTTARESELSFSALVQDDEGHPDLAKAQLMVWTIVALGVYLVATADAVTRTLATTDAALLPGLPDIDTTLLVLSGIGQGTYLATKVVNAPTGIPTTTSSSVSAGAASPATAAQVGRATVVTRAALAGPRSARVSGFRPSVNGFHFINSFPHEPDLSINLPGIWTVSIGDARNGLCGGMIYAVRDIFESGTPPIAAEQPPAPDTPLFHYIVSRLFDSFGILGLEVRKYLEWMATPDGDTGWGPFFARRGVAWKTITEEWPQIQSDLDANKLCCLGLITMSGINPADLGRNHQVLAYGYDLDADANLKLFVYDPNRAPDMADNITIALNLGQPTKPAKITSNVDVAESIRGFFETPYTYHDPRGQLGSTSS